MGKLWRSFHFGIGEIWALGSAFAYALDNVFVSVAIRGYGLDNVLGASLRSTPVLIFCILMGFRAARKPTKTLSPFSDLKIMAALIGYGVCSFAIANPLLFAAFNKGGVLVASPVAGTQVLWSVLLAALLLRDRLNRWMIVGIVIGIGGIGLLSFGRSTGLNLAADWWLAVPFALCTALGWALSGVFMAYVLRRGVDRFQALSIALLTGIICLNVYLSVTGRLWLYSSTPVSLYLRVLVAGMFNLAALVSITTALGKTTVASASTINSLQTALAPLIAWLVVGEDMNIWIAVGIIVIMSGVLVVVRVRPKAELIPQEPQRIP